MQILIRQHRTMIAAAVQRDVDGIPEGPHHASHTSLPLRQQFERDGVLRIALEQPFQDRDRLLPTAGYEVNLRQRHVRALVSRRPAEHVLKQSDGCVSLSS